MSITDNINLYTFTDVEISKYEKNQILESLNHVIGKIKNIEKFSYAYSKNNNSSANEMFMTYISICMLLGESKELLDINTDWDEIAYQYMTLIREGVQQMAPLIPASLFGGYAGIGFCACSLYKSTSYYKKFIDSINKVILERTFDMVKHAKNNLNNVHASMYDTIAGLSGIAGYLLQFKDDEKVRKCIESILEYFVLITNDREVFGEQVAGWYIPSENQFLDEEKFFYKKGNFNLGLSHGISGVLVILAIALIEDVEIEGQKSSIKRILKDLKKFNYIDKNGSVYWAGRIKFEDYSKGEYNIHESRASWCYGAPGIARAMYLGGKAINDKESIELSIKAFEAICNMSQEELMLDSPTICHGYAGLLATIQAMYFDIPNPIFDKGRKKVLNILLNSYDKNAEFGFYNIDRKDPIHNEYELISKDDITFLEGSVGVILTLLTFVKPIKTNWMRYLLIM